MSINMHLNRGKFMQIKKFEVGKIMQFIVKSYSTVFVSIKLHQILFYFNKTEIKSHF
jgi:hypothetical protein